MIAVERTSAEERNTWTAAELASALNDIFDAFRDLGRQTISAKTQLAQVRVTALNDSTNSNKANVILATAVLENFKERAKTLREYRSIVQTLIRGLP